MTLLIAHRGFWWPKPELQNHPSAVLAALSGGYAAEVDVWAVRDLRLVVKHDEFSVAHELMLPIVESSVEPLFLHAKGGDNGFPKQLVDAIRVLGWLDSAYVFCSPSNDALLATMKVASTEAAPVKTLVTVDSWDGLNELLDQPEPLGGADGAWLEQPNGDWVDVEAIKLLRYAGKSAWVVSSELHGRQLNLGRAVGCWQEADGICTDYPHLLSRVLDRDDAVIHPKEPWWE